MRWTVAVSSEFNGISSSVALLVGICNLIPLPPLLADPSCVDFMMMHAQGLRIK